MPTNYNYDKLPALYGSQDVTKYADTARKAEDSPSHDGTGPDSRPAILKLARCDTTIALGLTSFGTNNASSSTSSGFQKPRDGWEKSMSQIQRKPVPPYMQGSIRKHPVAEIEPTRIGRGVWKDQLLVDRSLRGMSLLMVSFAAVMIVVIAVNGKAFGERVNKYTSSVGGAAQDCKTVTHTNTALLLLINVAATMILGMSNTYQQLITSLKASDLKYMLEKFGDSRVGTNSPWNINRKRQGKTKSWAAWLLLVCTSVPIHFLANSLIGPSLIVKPPSTVVFEEWNFKDLYNSSISSDDKSLGIYQFYYDADNGTLLTDVGYPSFLCWSAFRMGRASFAQSTSFMKHDLYSAHYNGLVFTKIRLTYDKENCSGLANSWNDVASLEDSFTISDGYKTDRGDGLDDGSCSQYRRICQLEEGTPAKCRLNVRMNAAFVLTAALIIKAVY
ncbi:hypothetical protein GQ44DRAFT_570349, partial [Phaeosphaeriaceae sp. PMI808]